MSPFLSGSTLDALDRHRAAARRARRVGNLPIALWFTSPIGGAPVVLTAFVVSLVAIALGDHADALRVGVPGARRVR